MTFSNIIFEISFSKWNTNININEITTNHVMNEIKSFGILTFFE